MAYIDTSNMPLHMPVPGTREPAQIALLNENCVVIDAHDHGTGKGLAIGRLRSGLAANRPAAGTPGNVYFSTDTGLFNVDTGTAWVQFLTSGGQATVTGWTLIDPIIRDTLQFGPEGSGTIDASITRTAANSFQVNNNMGLGVAPGAWRSDLRALQYGSAAAVMADSGPGIANYLLSNVLWGATRKAITNNPGAILQFDGTSGLLFLSAPTVAAGADQTFTTRTQIAPNGTLTLTPATGQPALVANENVSILPPSAAGAALAVKTTGSSTHGRFGQVTTSGCAEIGSNLWFNGAWFKDDATKVGGIVRLIEGGASLLSVSVAPVGSTNPVNRLQLGQNGTLTLSPDAGAAGLLITWPISTIGFYQGTNNANNVRVYSAYNLELDAGGTYVTPSSDNSRHLGGGTTRWADVWSVNPALQTSHVSMKQDFAPLDPTACTKAVLDTDWLSFRYIDPAAPERVEGTGDEVWAMQQEAYQTSLEETAVSRQQKGYVLGSDEYHTDDLFGQSDRYSASTHADLAVVACALQDALRRLAALEARDGNAAAA
jgi:hypothetical protein